jgi:hypothetical protein
MTKGQGTFQSAPFFRNSFPAPNCPVEVVWKVYFIRFNTSLNISLNDNTLLNSFREEKVTVLHFDSVSSLKATVQQDVFRTYVCFICGVTMKSFLFTKATEALAPLILNFSTRWRWEVILTPRLLNPRRNRSHYPFNRWLAGSQSHSRDFEERISRPPD